MQFTEKEKQMTLIPKKKNPTWLGIWALSIGFTDGFLVGLLILRIPRNIQPVSVLYYTLCQVLGSKRFKKKFLPQRA